MAYSSSMNVDSMEEAVDDILRNFEEYRVTTDDVFVGPNVKDEDQKLRYLRLVVGDLTHIGCALAVYQSFQDEMTHLKCYLSHSPVQNMPVYNTDQPRPEDRASPRCGCPLGYREDEDCLCVPKLKNAIQSPFPTSKEYQPQQQSFNVLKPIQQTVEKLSVPLPQSDTMWPSPPSTNGTNVTCKPRIVMMPIFTLQNAPKPKKNKVRRRSLDTNADSAVTMDDFYFADEPTSPPNLTIRSQLLYHLKKNREKAGIQFYSSGEKRSQTHDQNWKKIVRLLDMLELKGKSAHLTSREVTEIGTKIKEIHDKVLGTTEYDVPEVDF
ncbi:uncharacterized protein LOC111350607 [Spodoptera litura]|uniref:Uncharacterized protein LOC111350607 n=1 Tax=Spodoptera litura TaxID=69820 RepID=A0A9J7DW68_SPOLT|nr:uncharacterized protein LOC111350607 [Spodoptera litura]